MRSYDVVLRLYAVLSVKTFVIPSNNLASLFLVNVRNLMGACSPMLDYVNVAYNL